MTILDNFPLYVAHFNGDEIEYTNKNVNGVLVGIVEEDVKDNVLVIPKSVSYVANNPKDLVDLHIRKIVVSENVKSIGKETFSLAKSLEEVEFLPNNNYINIDINAFKNSNIKSVKLDKVLNISEGCFSNNESLEQVNINELVNIDTSAFSNCSNLEEVTILSNPHNNQLFNFVSAII